MNDIISDIHSIKSKVKQCDLIDEEGLDFIVKGLAGKKTTYQLNYLINVELFLGNKSL